jgi:hypothetical protein
VLFWGVMSQGCNPMLTPCSSIFFEKDITVETVNSGALFRSSEAMELGICPVAWLGFEDENEGSRLIST